MAEETIWGKFISFIVYFLPTVPSLDKMLKVSFLLFDRLSCRSDKDWRHSGNRTVWLAPASRSSKLSALYPLSLSKGFFAIFDYSRVRTRIAFQQFIIEYHELAWRAPSSFEFKSVASKRALAPTVVRHSTQKNRYVGFQIVGVPSGNTCPIRRASLKSSTGLYPFTKTSTLDTLHWSNWCYWRRKRLLYFTLLHCAILYHQMHAAPYSRLHESDKYQRMDNWCPWEDVPGIMRLDTAVMCRKGGKGSFSWIYCNGSIVILL